MESLYVTCTDLKSRKEVNKHISALKMYYVYGNYIECSHLQIAIKELIINKIHLLREYKNIYFPKPSLITRLLRYIV